MKSTSLATAILVALVLAGCQSQQPGVVTQAEKPINPTPVRTATPTAQPPPPTPTIETPSPTPTPLPWEAVPKPLVCLVTDVAGIQDNSFNEGAWRGMTDARSQMGANVKYLESRDQTDYNKNIETFIQQDCDLILTIGFLLSDATQAEASTHPELKFSIADFAYDPAIPNVLGQVFAADEASFLAGYLAAGFTRTGKIGTFGGMPVPAVTAFMDGFALGAHYYGERHSDKTVQVLGWDPANQSGMFVGNFDSIEDGQTLAESLIEEGADIILPVAGTAGYGAGAAARGHEEVFVIGVDSDWYATAPEYRTVTLTSVLKNTDTMAFLVIKDVIDGKFTRGVKNGTLENGGVALAPFHYFDAKVSEDLRSELADISAAIINGEIATQP